jgi:hypothetical protein
MVSNLFEAIQQAGRKPFINYVNRWAAASISSNSASTTGASKNGFIFSQYKNLEDAFGFIEQVRNKPNQQTFERQALYFVSDPKYKDFSTFISEINKPNKSFDKIKKISKIVVENIKTLINLGGLYKNDRIIVTQDTNGVFDFGLASLGLYRPIEFYSEELKKDIEKGVLKNPYFFQSLENGVVMPDDVRKNVVGVNTFFIYSNKGKDYYCERRQRGATKVHNAFKDECFLKANQDGIVLTYDIVNQNKVFNGRGDAKLKYASNNKKSYLIYDKKDDSVKNVDIFMPINFLKKKYTNDASRGLALLPAFLIAATLEEFGIDSRISALRIGSDKSVMTTISIPVKDYNESSSDAFDKIYYLLSTSEYAEQFFGFFKVYNTNDGIQASPSGKYDASFSDVFYWNRNYMNSMLQRYKNWVKLNKDQPFVNTKVVNENFQFALSTVDTKIADANITYDNILSYLHQVFYSFYYYMDFLAIEMIEMNDFVRSLYKRITEDSTFNKIFSRPSTKVEIKDMIRKYILSILTEKYQVVSGGSYADSQEQINEKDKKFQEKVLLLNEALNIV